jgi:hypothetical protein
MPALDRRLSIEIRSGRAAKVVPNPAIKMLRIHPQGPYRPGPKIVSVRDKSRGEGNENAEGPGDGRGHAQETAQETEEHTSPERNPRVPLPRLQQARLLPGENVVD